MRPGPTHLLLALLVVALLPYGCTLVHGRWLLDALPGSYPDVVYYFPVDEPLIALTIDDGPDPAVTGELLDLLAEHDARATFFFVSENVEANEALVARAVREGHELGNHMTRDEVTVRLEAAVLERRLGRAHEVLSAFGPVRWFRPGSGWYDDAVLEAIDRHGYRLVEASHAPLDPRVPWPWLVRRYLSSVARPGAILVLHTRRGRGDRTLRVLERLVPDLQARGYRFVTLSELDARSTTGAAAQEIP